MTKDFKPTLYIKHIKPILFILLFFLLAVVVLQQVYKVVSVSDSNVLSKSEEYRAEIETAPKKWLNGYLGIFFRFKSIGNINWLLVPLALWFLLSGRAKIFPRGHKALVLVWILSTIFICVTGYSNSRYQLTLFPFTVFMVIYLLWELLRDSSQLVKVVGFSLLIGLCVYNIHQFSQQYGFFWDLKVTGAEEHFPQQVVDYFNSNKLIGKRHSRVYVFNQPFYYYHTQKRGIDYVSPFFTQIFVDLTRKEADRSAMHALIRMKSRIKYILVGGATLSQYRDRMLTEFLDCECKPLISEYGYWLFEVRDKSLAEILKNRRYTNLSQVSPVTAETHGIRGTFNTLKDTVKGQLVVSNLTANKEGVRLLQFGFDSLNPNSGLAVPQGKYMHFIVEATISKGCINRNNYIFIRDFTEKEKWKSTTTFFVSHLKRTYLISRIIRKDSTRMMMGIRFTPKSPEDYLIITGIRAYVSDFPL